MMELAQIDLALISNHLDLTTVHPEPGGRLVLPQVQEQVSDSPDIIVVGYLWDRWTSGSSGSGGSGNGGNSGGQYVDGDSADGGGTFIGNMTPYYPPAQADYDEITIDNLVARELTESEIKAIEALKQTIADVTKAIMSLPNNARIVLPNGEVISSAELKELWSTTDFRITEGTTTPATANVGFNSAVGPDINIDLKWLDRKDDIFGGVNYTVLHELGHTVDVSRKLMTIGWNNMTTIEQDEAQLLANDVAKFVADYAGLPIQQEEVVHGYTPGVYVIYEPLPDLGL